MLQNIPCCCLTDLYKKDHSSWTTKGSKGDGDENENEDNDRGDDFKYAIKCKEIKESNF